MRRWLRFLAKCLVAAWLVHLATGLAWLQALAAVALVLWGSLEALRVLARLLEAFSGPQDDDEGDDGGGPEEHLSPIVHHEPARREWRN